MDIQTQDAFDELRENVETCVFKLGEINSAMENDEEMSDESRESYNEKITNVAMGLLQFVKPSIDALELSYKSNERNKLNRQISTLKKVAVKKN